MHGLAEVPGVQVRNYFEILSGIQSINPKLKTTGGK